MASPSPEGALDPVLEVRDLRVAFRTDHGALVAVDRVSFAVRERETLGIVGESGSGKSASCLAIPGLLENAEVSGQIMFRGRDLLQIAPPQLRKVRGGEMGMVFQDPLASLNPFHRVGWQLVEAIRTHQDVSRRVARARAIDLLGHVGIAHPAQRVDSWPHEFSGGMRQRAMIAMALANEPALLIADEPTTALDVSVQAQILELIQRLKDELRLAVVLVTHNLGVVAQVADRISVMYAGRTVETGDPWDVFDRSAHPYTWGLLASVPTVVSSDSARRRLHSIPGLPPSLHAMPTGCRFHPRCPYVLPRCVAEQPDLVQVGARPWHLAACHRSSEREELRPPRIGRGRQAVEVP